MIVVRNIRQTCRACPSQWEGETDDERDVYVRYRWGRLTVDVSQVPGGSALGDDSCCVFEAEIGDELDGDLEYTALRAAVRDVIVMPAQPDNDNKWNHSKHR